MSHVLNRLRDAVSSGNEEAKKLLEQIEDESE